MIGLVRRLVGEWEKIVTEYNDEKDRVAANNWLCARAALAELDQLSFAYSALAEQCGAPGSFERENAKNANRGFRCRVDYLHDSLRRVLDKQLPTNV